MSESTRAEESNGGIGIVLLSVEKSTEQQAEEKIARDRGYLPIVVPCATLGAILTETE